MTGQVLNDFCFCSMGNNPKVIKCNYVHNLTQLHQEIKKVFKYGINSVFSSNVV